MSYSPLDEKPLRVYTPNPSPQEGDWLSELTSSIEKPLSGFLRLIARGDSHPVSSAKKCGY